MFDTSTTGLRRGNLWVSYAIQDAPKPYFTAGPNMESEGIFGEFTVTKKKSGMGGGGGGPYGMTPGM